MKNNPSIAFILNFIIPGLGLLFLGKWRQAILNLGLVLVVGVIVLFFAKEPLVWTATIGSISSGTWAYLVAQEMKMNANRTANHAMQTDGAAAPRPDR